MNYSQLINYWKNLAFSFLAFLFLMPLTSMAQLSPLSALAFENPYLGNPAYAGMDQFIKINGSIRKQMSGIPGSPYTQVITVDYGLGRVGLGLNILNESEGLLHSIRAVATYAYHVPLTSLGAFTAKDDESLNFGFSLGVVSSGIRSEDVIGDQNDISVANYNSAPPYIDGDLGLSYTSSTWSIQASAPNLRHFLKLKSDVADLPVFHMSVGYKWHFGYDIGAMSLEPKVGYRAVTGFESLWDAGANFFFAKEKVSLLGIYHSPGSKTFGAGLHYSKKLGISFMYTSPSTALTSYNSNGDFEANIRIGL